MTREPKRMEDMDIHGALFGMCYAEGDLIELYIEDDGWWHYKCSFNRLWLTDFIAVAKSMKSTLEPKPKCR